MSDLIDRQKAIDAIEDCAENANRSYKYDEEDAISRERAIKEMAFSGGMNMDGILYVPLKDVNKHLQNLPSVQPEIIRCKDCKYWKDSDGAYRRGFDAESKCPINLEEVYEGTFYCGMAERRE